MALRRKDKKVRKLNKTSFRRPASGRTAELFDLRETDDNSGASRNTDTYSGRQTGAGTYTGPDSRTSPYSRQNDSYQYSSYQNGSYQNGNEIQRPYRERHRVEVNRQDSYAYGQNGRTERYGSGAAAADDGQRYGNRVVHGNAPGSRTGRNDASVQREIEQDLIYDRQADTAEPETRADTAEPGAQADITEPEARTDTAVPGAQADTAVPEMQTDTAVPEAQADTAVPEVQTDTTGAAPIPLITEKVRKQPLLTICIMKLRTMIPMMI